MSPNTGSCIARGPNLSARRTPDQLRTGSGGAKRSSPIGGSANGIPRKTLMSEPGSRIPSTIPLVVAMRFWTKAFWLNGVLMLDSPR
jgi:hypothetical protein